MYRIRAVLSPLPECSEQEAWVGTQWRVRGAAVAHVFGGEDQLFRVVFRAEPDEVMALEHLGHPYFRAGWGRNVVGLLIDDTPTGTSSPSCSPTPTACRRLRQLAQRVPRPEETG